MCRKFSPAANRCPAMLVSPGGSDRTQRKHDGDRDEKAGRKQRKHDDEDEEAGRKPGKCATESGDDDSESGDDASKAGKQKLDDADPNKIDAGALAERMTTFAMLFEWGVKRSGQQYIMLEEQVP